MDYGLFALKTGTIVIGIIILLAAVIGLLSRNKEAHKAHVEVKKINDRYEDTADEIRSAMASKGEQKKLHKEIKARRKAESRQSDESKHKIFVLNFDGDIKASAVSSLREEITAVLMVASDGDEIFVKLQSPGGLVHSYGLAASQLARIKDRGLKLTVAVDKVAASGGYMMACIADRIIAAPFAIIGSIGVVAQIPNFNRVLKKHDIDYELITAGEYKRTLTMFGENTDEARRKFREDMEDTHVLFKDFVKRYREQVDIDEVSTGEHWFGARALEHKLVDELKTSDDYLLDRINDSDLYEIIYTEKKKLGSRISGFMQRVVDQFMFNRIYP
jgi:serine protease SohB